MVLEAVVEDGEVEGGAFDGEMVEGELKIAVLKLDPVLGVTDDFLEVSVVLEVWV